MSIVSIARPEIRELAPYSSARMEARSGTVMLNANESPWSASPRSAAGLNRYPEPQPPELVARLATLYAVRREQILVGRGSDEAIDLLVRAFCRAGSDAVAICPPTFGMYSVCARVQDAAVIEVPLTPDFTVDADALLAAVTPQTKLVFLCSPNNPTGGVVAVEVIERIATALADRALLVIDEAYAEFNSSVSAISFMPHFTNLAVLRTLSKAHALAGVRIGALVAPADVIALLRRIQAPYPLPAPCTAIAMDALTPKALREATRRVNVLARERERVLLLLVASAQVSAVLPSAANFLCVRFTDSKWIYRRLIDHGIVVRDVGGYPGLAGCLRISIGTADENEKLVEIIEETEVAA